MQTNKAEIQPIALSDAPELYFLTEKNRIYLKKRLPWLEKIRAPRDTEFFLKNIEEQTAAGKGAHWKILADSKMTGIIGVRDIESGQGIVGYWIDQDYQGRGIMTQALRHVIASVKTMSLLDKMILQCQPDHYASISIAKKCGFVAAGRLKEAENLYGKTVDHLVFHLNISQDVTIMN